MTDQDPRLDIVRQNIKIALAIRGTNAAETSRAAELSVNVLGSFLRGATSISYANLLRICDALKIPIGILHREGAITPGRIALQSELEKVSPERLAQILGEL